MLQTVQKYTTGRSKVLIVDDVSANLLAISALLEELDVDIYQADCGNEALSMVLEHEFSLVLLDVQMPEMDGYEVAKIMRSHLRTRHVPIIFLTANNRGENNRLKGYDAGAIDYIEKPIEEASLLAKVRLFKELNEKNRALERLHKKTEITLGSIPDPVICVQGNNIIYMNKPAELLAGTLGCRNACVSLSELFASSSRNLSQIQRLIRSLDNADCESDTSVELTFNVPKTSKSLIYEFRIAPLHGSNNTIDEVVLIFHDVTRLKSMSEELSFQAFHDALTHLPNRRFLDDIFKRAVARNQRNDTHFALMLVDLDNFKRVNDSAGHCAGDQVLCEAAARINSCLRDVDTLCRIGGDEFCILFEDVESMESIASLEIPAKRIVEAVAGPYIVGEEKHEIGASIGITSTLIDSERNLTSMLTDADLAMYEAKNSGKNQFVFFETRMRQDMNTKIRLDKELAHAITANEFCLYYQPQISVKNGNIIGLEALIRWNHPDKGVVDPAEFLSVLESTGMIKTVGTWIFEEVCRQIEQWKKSGIKVPCVSVNVSPKQFEQKELPEYIFMTMQKHGVKPKEMGIEITESLFMGLTTQVENNLNLIHEMGCKISMDDFGTGYSSLSYLLRFPIDVIKIDQSFVKNVLEQPQNQGMIRTIVSLGHGYDGMKVIAEGVENIAVLSLLKEIGCDFYQGYLHSKPMTADLVEKKLVENSVPIVVPLQPLITDVKNRDYASEFRR